MRRKGYTWNRNQQVYIEKGIKPKGDIEKTPATKKLEQALKLINEGKDPREVKKKAISISGIIILKRYEQQVGEISEPVRDEAEVEVPADMFE